MSAEECCENCVFYPSDYDCLVHQVEEVDIIDYRCDDWVIYTNTDALSGL